MIKDESKPSDFDVLKSEFKTDIQKARQRINELRGIIPQLEKELEQLIGMVTIMERVVQEGSDGETKPTSNGNKQDDTKKSGNG